jgi:hypothetical protein
MRKSQEWESQRKTRTTLHLPQSHWKTIQCGGDSREPNKKWKPGETLDTAANYNTFSNRHTGPSARIGALESRYWALPKTCMYIGLCRYKCHPQQRQTTHRKQKKNFSRDICHTPQGRHTSEFKSRQWCTTITLRKIKQNRESKSKELWSLFRFEWQIILDFEFSD